VTQDFLPDDTDDHRSRAFDLDADDDALRADAESDDDALLDDEFPLGDGTAETDAVIACPYCGEAVEITLDLGSGSDQEYVEDCEVCCRPWRVRVRYDRFGHADVEAVHEDD
jgi:hypothetical protein